jgi:bifunctional DNA-binding transcriptional regulator/antitoxin component of YhaV-PrlF toxin-antitoxin module
LPLEWQRRAVKTVTTLDKTQRLVLTKAMRQVAGISPGEKLEVTATPGLILIAPASRAHGRIVRKGKAKVFTGKIPDLDGAAVVNAVRHYTR